MRFCVPTFSRFHYANAFETRKGAIAVDLCRYPGFDLCAAFMMEGLRSGEAWAHAPVSKIARLHLDLEAKDGAAELD